MTRSAIQSVLHNFLGTYTSRYSDYDGYWLFGFLVADIRELRIDLLPEAGPEPSGPLAVAVRSAVVKFEDQVRKAGVARSQIREASLTVCKVSGPINGEINHHLCSGYNVNFVACAVMDTGRIYQRERIVFVAPHDPRRERRRAAVSRSSS